MNSWYQNSSIFQKTYSGNVLMTIIATETENHQMKHLFGTQPVFRRLSEVRWSR